LFVTRQILREQEERLVVLMGRQVLQEVLELVALARLVELVPAEALFVGLVPVVLLVVLLAGLGPCKFSLTLFLN
jgi:hypothetical protein